jgi:hypothetical protein
MATIGSFTKSGDDFTGAVKTVALNVKTKIARAEKENDKAPDYRIFAGQTEFGAAWKKTSGAGRRSSPYAALAPRPRQGSSPEWAETRANVLDAVVQVTRGSGRHAPRARPEGDAPVRC